MHHDAATRIKLLAKSCGAGNELGSCGDLSYCCSEPILRLIGMSAIAMTAVLLAGALGRRDLNPATAVKRRKAVIPTGSGYTLGDRATRTSSLL
jgi:hypothetical protein